uniref:Acetylglutamate kinase n=1 Tax=Polysiphonia sp. TaxID=1967842 RepID=A0A1Z1MUC4_9FLOR|nr:acetylglutamate kinase [Polysiphonia sp.]
MSNYLNFDRFYFSADTLHFIKKHINSTFIIKYGGSAMKEKSIQLNIIRDISLLYLLGIKIIVVHGGGYLVNDWLFKLNMEPRFHEGLRVTDSNTMEVVEMVLSGHVNKNLVSLFNQNSVPAIGLSGKDANLAVASHLFEDTDNLTGRVELINNKILYDTLNHRLCPVVASIATDSEGRTYNINADTLASKIAISMRAEKLILITDTPGLMYDPNDESTLIKKMDLKRIKDLKLSGIIKDGMIPKIDACIEALNNNVSEVHIIDGKLRHSLLHEVLSSVRVGSMIIS